MKSFLIVSVGFAALAAFIPACGSSDSGGGGAAMNTATTGDPAKGMVAFAKDTSIGACASCHGPDGGGALAPNISGSTTAGIGGWTEEQFYQVVRNRKAPSGKTVCQYMLAYPTSDLSDQDIADIYAYTQSVMSTNTAKGFYVMQDATCDHTK